MKSKRKNIEIDIEYKSVHVYLQSIKYFYLAIFWDKYFTLFLAVQFTLVNQDYVWKQKLLFCRMKKLLYITRNVEGEKKLDVTKQDL